jgi:hypothetical protein
MEALLYTASAAGPTHQPRTGTAAGGKHNCSESVRSYLTGHRLQLQHAMVSPFAARTVRVSGVGGDKPKGGQK